MKSVAISAKKPGTKSSSATPKATPKKKASADGGDSAPRVLVERKELQVPAHLAPPRLARVEGELLQMRVPPVEDLHQRGLGVEHLHRRGAADDQQLVILRLEIHLVRIRATG